ncbi:uncharacterized protein ABDE67_002815 [Symphorus nematophorus]
MIVLLLYILIICANVLLIVVICLNRSLHEPMFIFLCSLFVNELYGSTGLFPFLLLQILSDIHTVSTSFCFLQIFALFTYANVQFCNLAVMSYDRYLAICYPLQYNTRMTSNRIAMLIALTWLFPVTEVAVMISLSSTLQLCGNIINKVYCDNYSVVKLACSDTTVSNIYGLVYSFIIVVGVLTVIIYTYVKILKVCFSGSKETRQKAVSTCTPHIASVLNFCFGGLFEILQSRFNMNSVPNMLRIFLSLYFLTCQPLFNPLLYGLQMTKIRRRWQTLHVSYFTLSAYFSTGIFRHVCFMIVLLLYILIICANVLLIVVICLNRSLHEPMFIFLCSLFVNELYGSAGLFPFLLIQILSDIHTVSTSFCFLQIFCGYTYGNVQFFSLAVMSYDRYLAICFPLQYNTLMTSHKVAMLIALTWLFPFFEIAVMISLTSSLQLCGNNIDKVYCHNYSIVKLACSDTTANNIYGLVYTFTILIGLVTVIIYTYIKILKVCFSGSKETRQKAVSTCTPHLASLLNFSFGTFFEVAQSRFNMNSVPNMMRIFLSVYLIICQPLFNPVLYGSQMSKIHSSCHCLMLDVPGTPPEGGDRVASLPKPPQMAPFYAKEQRLYSESLT